MQLSFLDLNFLYIGAAIPNRRRIGGETEGWGGDQVLWKPSGVVVQVAGLVTVPGGSWGGKLVFLRLSGIVLHVQGLVTTPRGSWSGDQVLWKLSGVEFRWPDLLQHLEEVGAETRSCGSFQGGYPSACRLAQGV